MNAEIFNTARKYLDVAEVPGKEHNQTIVDWMRELLPWVSTDETPWCAGFMDAIARQTGHERSGSAAARSWEHVGQTVEEPKPGDVVVLWRNSPNSWTGHVGVYVHHNKSHVWVLGGNQGNRVSIAKYPMYRLLSFRRLNKEG